MSMSPLLTWRLWEMKGSSKDFYIDTLSAPKSFCNPRHLQADFARPTPSVRFYGRDMLSGSGSSGSLETRACFRVLHCFDLVVFPMCAENLRSNAVSGCLPNGKPSLGEAVTSGRGGAAAGVSRGVSFLQRQGKHWALSIFERTVLSSRVEDQRNGQGHGVSSSLHLLASWWLEDK